MHEIIYNKVRIAMTNANAKCRSGDCIHGPVFTIPVFGIEDFVIPGSRRDYGISAKNMGFAAIESTSYRPGGGRAI